MRNALKNLVRRTRLSKDGREAELAAAQLLDELRLILLLSIISEHKSHGFAEEECFLCDLGFAPGKWCDDCGFVHVCAPGATSPAPLNPTPVRA